MSLGTWKGAIRNFHPRWHPLSCAHSISSIHPLPLNFFPPFIQVGVLMLLLPPRGSSKISLVFLLAPRAFLGQVGCQADWDAPGYWSNLMTGTIPYRL